MDEMNLRETGDFIRNDLRLKTFPVAVKFLKSKADFPEKTRQPSVSLGKRIAVCQGITMARNYGWTIGLAREDVVCVPAAIMLGFSDSVDPSASLAELFCEVKFSASEDVARKETSAMSRFEKGEIEAMVFAPLQKADFKPDTVLFYGNPAQMMRFTQAWAYTTGERVLGHFGGKVECDEYLVSPFKMQSPRLVNPGNGERIFAAAQDDEMAFAIPGSGLPRLVEGLREVGGPIGIRYPVTPYQNYQPDLPKAHKKLGKELGIL